MEGRITHSELEHLFVEVYPTLVDSYALKRRIRRGLRTTEEIAADALGEVMTLTQSDYGGTPEDALWRIAYRLADSARYEAERGPLFYGVVEDMHPAASRELDGVSLRQWSESEFAFAESFDTAVRGLDDPLRAAFILGELRGLPSREAGVLLGVSHTTAATHRELATTIVREEIAQ